MRPNRVQLQDLLAMDSAQIAALPVDQLALLKDDAAEALAAAKAAKDRIEDAIDRKYGDRAASLRRRAGKDTGTVRIEDGDFVVIAELSKRVTWDQAQLAALIEQIRSAGEVPSEYIETTYRVAERNFSAWPSHIRAAFLPARTVEPGKPTYRIEQKENA